MLLNDVTLNINYAIRQSNIYQDLEQLVLRAGRQIYPLMRFSQTTITLYSNGVSDKHISRAMPFVCTFNNL